MKPNHCQIMARNDCQELTDLDKNDDMLQHAVTAQNRMQFTRTRDSEYIFFKKPSKIQSMELWNVHYRQKRKES